MARSNKFKGLRAERRRAEVAEARARIEEAETRAAKARFERKVVGLSVLATLLSCIFSIPAVATLVALAAAKFGASSH
jgi:hypothetical protein